MTSENPYVSPLEDSTAEKSRESPPTLGQTARPIFLAWEKLRIAYVLVLALVSVGTLLSSPTGTMPFTGAVLALVGGAIVANVCYFAGPMIESYVTWLGYRGHVLRWSLFLAGTAFASLLAFLLLAPSVM